MSLNVMYGSFTTPAATTTQVIDTGATPAQITVCLNDGSLVAMYVAGVTCASVKGTFAATFTVGVDANGLYGVTIGGLTAANTYKYVIVK
jgi:hypothetical protein